MTTLFSDDFENGDFAAWTGTFGTIEVQSAIKHQGQYACYSSIATTHKTNHITKTVGSQTGVYLRFYAYFDSFPSGTWEFLVARCAFNSARPMVTLYSSNSSIYWRLRDGGGTARTYTSGPAAQTWYCLEIKAVAGDESALYINGEKILSGTAPSGSSSSIYLMCYTYTGTPDGLEVAFDDVLYSDTYIGPQNLTHTVTDSLSSSESQLCNKQFHTAEVISATEHEYGDKSFTLTDQAAYQEQTAVSKQLPITENLCLTEAANIGIRGHVKTKLFLYLADLAVQLTGD